MWPFGKKKVVNAVGNIDPKVGQMSYPQYADMVADAIGWFDVSVPAKAVESVMSTATAPVALVATTTHVSFLKKLENFGLTALTKVLPFLEKEATEAEPLVDLLFPAEGPLFNSVVTAISTAQLAGTAAAGSATGADKFQAVYNAVSPGLLAEAQKDGLVGDAATAAVNQYIQAIYLLFAGPAKVGATPAAKTA